MNSLKPILGFCFSLALMLGVVRVTETVEVSSLAALAEAATKSGGTIRLRAGIYRMADYLTPEVLDVIRAGIDRTQQRPPVPMFVFRGNDNRFDLRDVVLEIDTSLYHLLPQGGYTRCLIIAGHRNRFDGLTIRSTGPNQGSNGNILSVAGEENTLENFTLQIHGSYPYGYGDLFGKGGPNLLPLQKQSGVQVLGTGTTLRRCKVFSRALGHCFYIQAGNNICIEDCYAEGATRLTTDMLRETSGPAFDLGFKSVYENRDGRYMIAPGYSKSVVEDGFRTYGGAGNVTLVNCTAINTRAGFEIGARDNSPVKTIVENCVARGCERAYLIGSQTIVRHSSGDIAHGPLLYLRGGRDSEVELEVTGDGPQSLVHVLATIAGENHRVHLTARAWATGMPALPIMLGFGMPDHGEMASPIRPLAAKGIILANDISSSPVIASDLVEGGEVKTNGRTLTDKILRTSPGPWGGASAVPPKP
jgi:hypothetical protein